MESVGPAIGLAKGVCLIEIVLALALLSTIIALTFGAQWAVGDLSLNNARAVSAINIANLQLTNVLDSRILSAQDTSASFGVLNSLVTKPFTRCEYTVGSESVWRTGWRSTSTNNISLLVSDLEVAGKYGKDCGGQPEQFWNGGFVLLDTINLGFSAVSVDVSKDYIFVSLRPTQESDPDMAVVSLNPPRMPLFLNTGVGINKIDVSENYAFAAQHSSSSQLAVIDVSDVSNPEIVATTTLPGVAGSRPEAISIFYFDSRVYVGTKRTAGREFHIFDVSNPESPRWLGSREVNHNINDIAVKDGFAFLATSGNIRDLIVLDVRDPANIVQSAAIDLLGNEDGRSIHVAGNSIFLGRHKSVAPGRDELHVLEYRVNPDDGSLEISSHGSAPTGADVQSIAYAGGFVFAATSNAQKTLQIFELNRQGRPVQIAERNFPANATGIDFENDLFAVTSGQSLYIFKQEQNE